MRWKRLVLHLGAAGLIGWLLVFEMSWAWRFVLLVLVGVSYALILAVNLSKAWLEPRLVSKKSERPEPPAKDKAARPGRPIEETPSPSSTGSSTPTQDSGGATEKPELDQPAAKGGSIHPERPRRTGTYGLTTSDVLVTTVTPEGVRPGARFQVEVHFHLEGIEIEGAPGQSVESEVANLSLQEGATLTVRLVPMDDGAFRIDDPEAPMRWRPPARKVEFRLRVAKDLEDGVYDLRVEFWCGAVQLDRSYFEIAVSKDAPEPRRGRQAVARRRLPRSAFASYSRLDRVRVLERIDSLKAVGIEVFLDCLDIKPAENWQAVLEKEIRRRDTLLLFWSTAAASSEWVDKEWRYTLYERGPDYILPNALEPPQRCKPPDELAHLHFGSVLIELAEKWRQEESSMSPRSSG